jgi:hypothetical protein
MIPWIYRLIQSTDEHKNDQKQNPMFPTPRRILIARNDASVRVELL